MNVVIRNIIAILMSISLLFCASACANERKEKMKQNMKSDNSNPPAKTGQGIQMTDQGIPLPTIRPIAKLQAVNGFTAFSAYRDSDGMRLLYSISQKGKKTCFVNSRQIVSGDELSHGEFLFDGSVILNVKNGNTNKIILDDGQSRKTVAEGTLKGPWRAPDAHAWSYLRQVRSKNKDTTGDENHWEFLPGVWKYVDSSGNESPDLILREFFKPVWSAQARHYALSGWRSESGKIVSAIIYLDGRIYAEYPPESTIGNLRFDDHGHLCYLVSAERGIWSVMGSTRRNLSNDNPREIPKWSRSTFSPNGKDIAYPVNIGSPGQSILGFVSIGHEMSTYRLALNGKMRGKKYIQMGKPLFSPDGSSLAVRIRESLGTRAHEEEWEQEGYLLNGKLNPNLFPYVHGISFQPAFTTIAFVGGGEDYQRYVIGSLLLQKHSYSLLSPLEVSPSGRFVTYIVYSVGSDGPKILHGDDSDNEAQDLPLMEPGRIAVAVLGKDGKEISIIAELAGPKEDWIGYPEILTNQHGEEMISYLVRRGDTLAWVIAYPGGVRDYDVRSAMGQYRDMNIRWNVDMDVERKTAYTYAEKDGHQVLILNHDGTFSLQIYPTGATKPSIFLGGNFILSGYNSILIYNGGVYEQTSDSSMYHFKAGVPAEAVQYFQSRWEYDPKMDRIETQYDFYLTDRKIPKDFTITQDPFHSYFKRVKD